MLDNIREMWNLRNIISNRKRLTAILVFAALALFVAVKLISFPFKAPGSGKTVVIVDVAEGSSLSRIADDLARSHVVTNARLFAFYARLKGAQSRLKAGAYQLTDAMPPAEILRKMLNGEVFVERFAVPEGYSIYQLAELLESRRMFSKDSFLAACRDKELLKELNIRANSVEGYLYPSTYDVPKKMSAEDLIRLMVKNFARVYAERFEARVNASGMKRGEILTLASMIEKEARQPSERPLISSVFHNRLTKGMRLQSDPTAIYGVRAFGGKVAKQDVLRGSPYNTYLIHGLPPGPIGNPSAEAIEAALNPAQTDYLYFVARQDGSHLFTRSLDEHNKGVNKYLKANRHRSR